MNIRIGKGFTITFSKKKKARKAGLLRINWQPSRGKFLSFKTEVKGKDSDFFIFVFGLEEQGKKADPNADFSAARLFCSSATTSIVRISGKSKFLSRLFLGS